MATPLGLLSFRKNVTRIVKEDGGGGGGDDGDDNGWVHGGKYVPKTTASTAKRQQSSSGPAATAVKPTVANAMPSPYSMLSPPPLNTPLPPDTIQANSNTNTPRIGVGRTTTTGGASTPLTTQLQRLLAPTPSVQSVSIVRTNSNTPIATPTSTPVNQNARNNFQRGGNLTPLPPPPATPVEKFLRESGVTPKLSHSLGNAAFKLSSMLFTLVVFVLKGIGSGWNAFTTNHPHMATDIIESLFESILDTCTFAWKAVRLSFPYLLWTMQTLIALTLTVGGTIVWALVMLIRGRDKADKSSVGEVHQSAIKSLRENVRNSPFKKDSRFRRGWEGSDGRLPFMGFSHMSEPSPQRVKNVQHSASRIVADVNDNADDRASSLPSSSSTALGLPAENKSTTPSNNNGAIRSSTRNSILKQRTPHNKASSNNISLYASAATPASAARRVLFSESEHGEVSTEQFEFDKHLPASARKVNHRGGSSRSSFEEDQRLNEMGGERNGLRRRFTPKSNGEEVEAASSTAIVAMPLTASPSMSTHKNANHHPLQNLEQDHNDSSGSKGSDAAASKNTKQTEAQPQTSDGKKAKPMSSVEEERKKQQYIQRYGLLPTITPLSKRYGRLKQRQQQQGQEQPNGPPANASNNKNFNRKRRGDLLGAASRLGRHRRARIGNRATNSLLPTVRLSNNRTPMKRRRDEQAMSRTDEWVWRAMNHDEKENRKNDSHQVGSAVKRGKFALNEVNGENGGDNKCKSNPTTLALPPVMTPPKTPGPSKFVAAATPAPGKGKPSIPSFSSSGESAAASGSEGAAAPGFSFGAVAASTQNEDAATRAVGGPPGISFGTAFASETQQKNESSTASASVAPIAAPGFSFGAPAVTTAGATEKKDAAAPVAPAFAFGNNQQGASKPAGSVAPPVASATTVPISFGDSSKPGTSIAAAGAAFSFGASASAPGAAGGAAPPPAASTPAQFSFGASAQQASSTAPTTVSGLSFGAPTATTATAMEKKDAAPPAAPAFAFGNNQHGASKPAGSVAPPAASANTVPISFGDSSKPGTSFAAPVPSVAAFSFGTPASATGAAGGAAPPPAASTPAQFSFGASSQPAPTAAAAQSKQQSAPSSGAAFSFGSTASASVMPGAPTAAAPPSSFLFGAGAAPSGAAPTPPAFGAASVGNSFRLGGSTTSRGASARRRAANGRRR